MCPPFLNFTERSASANCSALARTDLFRSVYSTSLTSEVFLQLKSDYLVMVVSQTFGSQSLVLGFWLGFVGDDEHCLYSDTGVCPVVQHALRRVLCL